MWQTILKPIDKLIDSITMYRLLMYYLSVLLAVAMIFSFAGIMHYNPLAIAGSALTAVVSCWLINKLLAAIFHAPINPESSILTGLILALIISPGANIYGFLFLIAASGLAMGSKYLLTIKGKHIFNPAAVAVFLTAIGPHQSASWWVGTSFMLPFVLAGGILVTRKVRRGPMVISFLVATSAATLLFAVIGGTGVVMTLQNMVLNSAAFYLGFVMLTEPYTSPTTRNLQIWYAVIVGVILAPQAHIGHYYSTPEFALVIGNLFAYITGNKVKLFPRLLSKRRISIDSAEFIFAPSQPLAYLPGQYMEWTLPHPDADSRGVRRYFTLASSPTEREIKIGVKFYEDGSSFKNSLLEIGQATPIVAAQLSGDFVLPDDPKSKLVFIAGGIGITPFRSMIKYLTDKRESRDIHLLYSVRQENELAYRTDLAEAKQTIGLKVTYVVTSREKQFGRDHVMAGRIDGNLITRLIPDYHERIFYISGSQAMVDGVQQVLHDLGVSHFQIKTDFFPGFA